MNILLIDGAQVFGHSQGRLNRTLHQLARDELSALGHSVRETSVENGYDPKAEVEKFLWMDAVIWQMPGWWMGLPWKVKEYVDLVFTAGANILVANDGRHRATPTEGYGTGGLLHGKHHMLSLTWNAPIEAFTRPGDFFDGAGVDAVYLHFHKANEFLGMKPLPTYICNDVVKNPQIARFLADYTTHLQRLFPA